MNPMPYRRSWKSLALATSAVLAAAVPAGRAGPELLGFRPDRTAAQLSLEARFDAQLSAKDQVAWLERMSSQPNQVGSPHDKANAEFMREQFRSWGWDARIETFEVLYPTPKKLGLELVGPSRYVAKLGEPAVSGDSATDRGSGALPPYTAFGGDGDVTAEMVYVNQGMPADYEELDRLGIGVKGKIVITRYGGGWRGLKPKLAQEHGAAGCIIYSDPKDDGYGAGDVYPKGGYRPGAGVQRGSVLDTPVYPGDPLTPGIGATHDAKRLVIAEARTILKIPVLPISYADAQPFLAALEGPVAPEKWRGGLGITYHVGPGPARGHLTVVSDWTLKPIYDVIAVRKGSEFPDEWVMRGNHHDGWVYGAWDPLSANVALMAEAKAFGALAREGLRPRRTLVYASWDAEEPGLIGSTEWCETHEAELRQKLVLYVNSDTNSRGFLRIGGSHAYQYAVDQVGSSVRDPETGVSALERLRARILVDGTGRGAAEDDRREVKTLLSGGMPSIEAMGSGSDYTPFLQHVGISALDIRYGGEDAQGGVYHSAYDSFAHYERFGDPGGTYGVVLSQTIGRMILRTANADVLPMRFEDFAATVARYGAELHELVAKMREATERKNALVKSRAYELAADPTEKYVPPQADTQVPEVNLAALDNAIKRLKKSAAGYDQALAKSMGAAGTMPASRQAELNGLLRGMEQSLLSPQGLPGRAWYRHMIYAPGLMTGYGVKTLPGIREAIEARRWLEAEAYSSVVSGVLGDYCERLDRATGLLERTGE